MRETYLPISVGHDEVLYSNINITATLPLFQDSTNIFHSIYYIDPVVYWIGCQFGLWHKGFFLREHMWEFKKETREAFQNVKKRRK